MRRRTVLGAAAAALAVGLSGCGIPDETKVRDVGPGPDPRFVTGGGVGQGPPTREKAPTKEIFVDNFLSAAAGDPREAEKRIRQYVTEDGYDRIKVQPDGINVVRPTETTFREAGHGRWRVTLTVDQVGLLNQAGSVGPATEPGRTTYEFTIGNVEGTTGWFVTDPPAHPLLSTNALVAYYIQRTIYFWSRDWATLVPDNRYMPSDLDKAQQPTRIVEWVLEGPPDWLGDAVNPLRNSRNLQNVPYPKPRLEVLVGVDAGEQQALTDRGIDLVDHLGKQLMWSLRPYMEKDLQLGIEGQGTRIFLPDRAFYLANAAHREDRDPSVPPERFALHKGKIYRLRSSPDGGTAPLPQLLLAEGVNQGLVSAALARETTAEGVLTAAAVVAQQGQRSWLRVGSAVGDGAHPFAESGPYEQIGRPAWLKAPMRVGLVPIAGHLYRFTLDSAKPERVALPPEMAGKVVSVSAAPDGRRIAVVAGEKLYLLAVTRGEGEDVEIEKHRVVPTRVRGATAVDWAEETQIVVAGDVAEKPAVWQVTPDGAIEDDHTEDTGGKVLYLAAYPNDPVSGTSINVMFDRQGASYDYEGGKPLIEAAEVVGASGEFDPADVAAPFFLLD